MVAQRCRRTQLPAKPADVHIEAAIQWMKRALKDTGDEFFARQHNSGGLQKCLQQGKLNVS